MTAVSQHLFGVRLGVRGGQREKFLRILGGQNLLGGNRRFFQRGLGSVDVQVDQLFNAFKGLVGQRGQQCELGFKIGFGGCRKLFWDSKHKFLLYGSTGTAKSVWVYFNWTGTGMVHCNKPYCSDVIFNVKRFLCVAPNN